jgi:2-polyprenyl-3-methyl-5-hydroxy-6-metoxy-1,4-benzoquinol methylase
VRDLDAYQREYGNLPFEESQARYRKRRIIESIAKYRPRSILEVGCGLDPLFNHYRGYERCTIVEPGDEFVRNARECARALEGITIVHGSLERNVAILSATPYDFVVLSSLLHEIPDSKNLLDATARLCGPGTIVHVNVPNARSIHRLLAVEMGLNQSVYERSQTQQRMQQSQTFDADSLAALVSQSGFEIVEQGTFFIKPFTHAQMASLQTSGMLTEPMLEGLYKLSKHFPENGSEIFMDLKLRARQCSNTFP